MEASWRAGLPQESRNRIVGRITETLERHTPVSVSGLNGTIQHWRIASSFEERIFYAASDRADYLRKISLKVLNLETRRQNAALNEELQQSAHQQRLHATETDWRAGFPQDSRNNIVDRMMDTLLRHNPLSGQDGTSELWSLANHFEDKVFYTAADQDDYLRIISLEMLKLEASAQGAALNARGQSSPSSSSTRSHKWSNLRRSKNAEREDRDEQIEQQIISKHAAKANWRAGLSQDARNKLIGRIWDTLQRHTLSGPDGASELWKLAERFEENIFNTASDQHDYLRKISLKMMNLETRAQEAAPRTCDPRPSMG